MAGYTTESDGTVTKGGLALGAFSVRHLLAVPPAIIVALSLANFPFHGWGLALGLGIYAVALYRWREIWVAALPALLPVLDLTMWSGRFFWTEYDIFLLVTLTVLILPAPALQSGAPSSDQPLQLSPIVIPSLIGLSVVISTAIQLMPWPSLQLDSFSDYKSPFNALRVAKGFLWGLAFTPFLLAALRRSRDRTIRLFLAGVLIGTAATGLAVIWERGVFAAIWTGQGVYGVLESLLDTATSYRATGLFSAMHVGGTSIDGYLAVVLMLSVPACVYASKRRDAVLAALALGLGLYAALFTFSRGLYAGLFVGGIVAVILILRREGRGESRRATLTSFGFFAFAAILAWSAFSVGGYQALLWAIIAVSAVALLSTYAVGGRLRIAGFLAGVMLLATGFGIQDAISESRWQGATIADSLLYSVLLVIGLAAFAFAAFRSRIFADLPTPLARFLLMLFLALAVTLPTASGYRMTARGSSAATDFIGRIGHWWESAQLMGPSLGTQLFGAGVGSYPRLYHWTSFDRSNLVDYTLGSEPGEPQQHKFLRLKAGDFSIVQRLPMRPHTDYRLEYRIRGGEDGGGLLAKFCEKHILYSDRYVPNCVIMKFRASEPNQWLTGEANFNSGALGSAGWAGWPVNIMIYAFHRPVVDVDYVRVFDPEGREITTNSGFDANMDRWVFIRDFEHLDWHVKNLFLHFYLEQGLFGAFAVALAVAVFLLAQWRAYRSGSRMAIGMITAMIAVMVVGLFGTVLDNPRVTTLFTLVLVAGLVRTNDVIRPTREGAKTASAEQEPK